MKILLIYTIEDKELAIRILSIIDKPDMHLDTLELKSVEDRDIKHFTDYFHLAVTNPEEKKDLRAKSPSHAIILSPLSTRWCDFLAGFSCGYRLNLLIYGQEAISGISEEFASYFTFFHTEESFHTFFDAEYKAFIKQEAAREVIKAQDTLLRMGIPVTAESLSQCASDGTAKEVALFLSAGFSPDTRNKAGVPLLHSASRSGNVEVVQYLISVGAQLDLHSDDRGGSALFDAALAKKNELVKIFIDAGADLNIKSKDGQSALIVSVGSGDEKISELLLAAGADPDIPDSLGVSARKYANLFHQETMLNLFRTYAPEKTA